MNCVDRLTIQKDKRQNPVKRFCVNCKCKLDTPW